MRFIVPKFIEMEPKLIGPLTFRQFIYIGLAGAVGFILYFLAPFYLFVLGILFLGGGALALAFLKVEGVPLPEMIKNFLLFSTAPKIYLWKKVPIPPKIIKKPPPPKEVSPLKIAESRLRKLFTKIETKPR